MPPSCQDGDRAGWHHTIARFMTPELVTRRDHCRAWSGKPDRAEGGGSSPHAAPSFSAWCCQHPRAGYRGKPGAAVDRSPVIAPR